MKDPMCSGVVEMRGVTEACVAGNWMGVLSDNTRREHYTSEVVCILVWL